jgi:hypothetical protein
VNAATGRRRVGRVTARWSHLTVGPDGDLAELHAFAAAIGLRRAWFQDKPWPPRLRCQLTPEPGGPGQEGGVSQ